jgi:membrane protein DedA with SNARE-associated domain
MSAWIEEMVLLVMDRLGYVGIFLLLFIECVFPPIPSELIIPLAGFATVRGDYSFFWVIVASTLGSLAGALVLYYIGKVFGAARLMVWADLYGKWLGISGKDIQRSTDWFQRHGTSVVFFCRFIPGIRSLISIPAGVVAMPLLPFILLTTAGSALWNIALAYVGVVLGNNYHLVEIYISPISRIVLVGGVLVVVGWVAYRMIQSRRSPAA